MQHIYRSDGEVVAVVHQGNLYNMDGEWIGFLQRADVYDAGGHYLGYLSEDRRLLRSRNCPKRELARHPVDWPARLRNIPERFPLAPLFKQLPYGIVDVFEEHPERFQFLSDLRPDQD